MQTSPYFVWVNFLITIAQRNLEPLIDTLVWAPTKYSCSPVKGLIKQLYLYVLTFLFFNYKKRIIMNHLESITDIISVNTAYGTFVCSIIVN